ncbi:Type II/IV secretion system ATP hydrolase TadA/VirB11/CpaF, TadA subfamily, partial [hydrothermal vent metagenome]
DGSMTTLHANNTADALRRLEILVLMAVDLPVVSIHRQIASAIDVVVQIRRLPGGRRMITQISEIAGYDPERKNLIQLDIFRSENDGPLQPTGYLPTFIDTLVERNLLNLEFLYGNGKNTLSAKTN